MNHGFFLRRAHLSNLADLGCNVQELLQFKVYRSFKLTNCRKNAYNSIHILHLQKQRVEVYSRFVRFGRIAYHEKLKWQVAVNVKVEFWYCLSKIIRSGRFYFVNAQLTCQVNTTLNTLVFFARLVKPPGKNPGMLLAERLQRAKWTLCSDIFAGGCDST